ncbi:MAG TPA: cytochrome c maturation protein CcmE, partial [Thermomonas sp.]|nr:cytochrome c maturation protein CcmE [Thermomonas sp.]
GTFVATEVLAKHDENYMPSEVAEAIAKAKAKSDAAAQPGSG